MVEVRAARDEDAGGVARVYSQGIAEGLATFETRPRSADEVREWWHGPRRVLVAATGSAVLGFASTSAYRPRPCYEDIAEYSVYVAGDARGQGIGKQLLDALIAQARGAGVRKLVARILAGNTASRRLAAACDFREVGVYERHGRIGDVWHDVVIVERLLR